MHSFRDNVNHNQSGLNTFMLFAHNYVLTNDKCTGMQTCNIEIPSIKQSLKFYLPFLSPRVTT